MALMGFHFGRFIIQPDALVETGFEVDNILLSYNGQQTSHPGVSIFFAFATYNECLFSFTNANEILGLALQVFFRIDCEIVVIFKINSVGSSLAGLK